MVHTKQMRFVHIFGFITKPESPVADLAYQLASMNLRFISWLSISAHF